jgi:hypothetical protein
MRKRIGSFGTINSLEYEEILVSHSQLPLSDYVRIRLAIFFYVLFNEAIFAELVRFLDENGANVASLFRFIIKDGPNWPDIFADLISKFEADTRGEMIPPEELKYDFTKKELEEISKNFRDINAWNLCRLFAPAERVASFRTYLEDALRRLFDARSIETKSDDISLVLTFCFDKLASFPEVPLKRTVEYPADPEAWLTSEAGLGTFRTGPAKYLLTFDKAARSEFKRQYARLNDPEAALYAARTKFRLQNPSRAYTYDRKKI